MLRQQAEQGRTVIVGTQSPEITAAADRAAILTKDGSLAWYGSLSEAREYFKEALQSDEPVGFGDLLAAVDNPENQSGKEWAKRFAASPDYGKNIDAPLFGKQQDLLLEDRPLSRLRSRGVEAVPPAPIPRISGLGQLFILIGRNFKLFIRDRTAVAIAFLVPVILAGLEFILAGPNIYDPLAGDATRVVLVTALIAFLVLLVAA